MHTPMNGDRKRLDGKNIFGEDIAVIQTREDEEPDDEVVKMGKEEGERLEIVPNKHEEWGDGRRS